MGYYTTHTLKVKDPAMFGTIEQELEEVSDLEGLFEDSWKWYDQDAHCIAVSKANPDVLFAIQGEGEEQGDIWMRTYHNGEMINEWRPEAAKLPEL